MENNDRNIIEEIAEKKGKKVEEIEEVQNGINDKQKKKIIILIISSVVLLIVLGIIVGIASSKNNGSTTNNTVQESVEKKEDVKTGKKLYEDKPWVYEADYGKDKKVKKVGDSNTLVCNTKESLVFPYININSEDAKKANEEIEKLYNRLYSEFGNGSTGTVYRVSYNYYENDNILSIVIKYANLVIPGGTGKEDISIYNFNLDTLEQVTLDEMAKLCGFSRAEDVLEKIKNWEKRQIEILQANSGGSVGSFEGVEVGKYFIDQDKKLNFVYRESAAGSYVKTQIIEVNSDIEDIYEEVKEEEKKSYFEENSELNYTNNIRDNDNGKVALLKMGESVLKTEECDGYYIYKDKIFNTGSYYIKEVTSIKSMFIDTSITNDVALFKCTVEYVDNNDNSKSLDLAVLVNTDNSNASIEGPFDNYTASTKCNKKFGQYSFLYKGLKKFDVSGDKYHIPVENEYEVYYTIKTREIDGIVVTSKTDTKSVVIHIDSISDLKHDVAAGTEYTEFSFSGYEEGTYKKHSGKGTLAVNTDGYSYSLSLDLSFDSAVMDIDVEDENVEIPGSTVEAVRLECQAD